jgi:DNA modification methylase
MTVDIRIGNALEVLRGMAENSVHMVCTSPPYWGLRDYGTGQWEGGDQACDHSSVRRGHDDEKQATSKGTSRDPIRPDCRYCGARRIDQQIGLEITPEAWTARLVEVFREVRRVLRPDGTLWLNIGDAYAGSWGNQGRKAERGAQRPINGAMLQPVHDGRYPSHGSNTGKIPAGTDLKPKDLIGLPWLLAFALRADGWWLRSEIIWAKPNPMPESVTDRPTKAHEQVFLLTKSANYYYDQEAVRERANLASEERYQYKFGGLKNEQLVVAGIRTHPIGDREFNGARNMRSVWTIATEPFAEAHFATFPTELARRCILAGTSAKGVCPACGAPWVRVVERTGAIVGEDRGGNYRGRELPSGVAGQYMLANGEQYRPGSRYEIHEIGWSPSCSCDAGEPVPAIVLDPFGGAGTTGLVAELLGRNAILIELNPEYAEMARRRIDNAKARRMIGEAERVQPMPGQLVLL